MNFRATFITAHPDIKAPLRRRRAEVLSYLLAGNLAIMIFMVVFVAFRAPEAFPSLVEAVILNVVAYLFSRSRHYKIGAVLLIFQYLISVPYTVLTSLDPQIVATTPVWLALVTLLSSLVLPMRYTLMTIAGMTLSFGVMAYGVKPHEINMLVSSYLFCFASSCLALLGTYLLQRSDEMLELERAKLLQVSKLSALGEIAAGVAHEINTPLASIVLNAEMIEREISKLDQPHSGITKRAQAIVQIGERIAKIISGLKDFARDASADQKQSFSVKEWIDSTVELCGQRFANHGVDLRILPKNLDVILNGQDVQLSQTLLNLLNNSYDAVLPLEQKWIQIEVTVSGQAAKFLELRVTDSGAGLAPKIVDRVFQPFFTTKEIGKGTGLGLSISLNILKHHNGDLFYDETSAHTAFVIRLPLTTKSGAQT